jgi:hypothetical protein
VKMYNRLPLLEEPFAQTLSGINMYKFIYNMLIHSRERYPHSRTYIIEKDPIIQNNLYIYLNYIDIIYIISLIGIVNMNYNYIFKK